MPLSKRGKDLFRSKECRSNKTYAVGLQARHIPGCRNPFIVKLLIEAFSKNQGVRKRTDIIPPPPTEKMSHETDNFGKHPIAMQCRLRGGWTRLGPAPEPGRTTFGVAQPKFSMMLSALRFGA